MIRLVKPTARYQKSFIAAMKEFKRKEREIGIDIRKLQKNFPEFVARIRSNEKRDNLTKGQVLSSYYWLIDKSEFIGDITIRHKLTEMLSKEGGHIDYGIKPTKRRKGYGIKILALALRKAKTLGIKKVLITCDDNNIGSWKIIEANGGILHDKISYKGGIKRRYWVDTP